MIEVIPLQIGHLNADMLQQCQQLLRRPLWKCLEGHDPWDIESAIISGFLALDNHVPVGLAITSFRPSMQHARLIWLYTTSPNHKETVYEQLISSTEKWLIEHKCTQLSHIYPSDLPHSKCLEKTLHKLGWSSPTPFSARCHFCVPQFAPSWLYYHYKVPHDCEIFPWEKLTDNDRLHIHNKLNHGRIPLSVSPFHDEKTIEPLTSFGMRKNGEIIGWNITNTTESGILQYSSLFIDREYQFLGYSILLLVESIRALKTVTKFKKAMLDVTFEEVDARWTDFIKNRLMPSCSKVERSKISFHLFHAPDFNF